MKTPGYPEVYPFAYKVAYIDGTPLLGRTFPIEVGNEKILLWAEEALREQEKREQEKMEREERGKRKEELNAVRRSKY